MQRARIHRRVQVPQQIPRPPAPPQVSPVSGGSTPPDSGVARRLRELDALRKDGLISEAEYQEKRKAILSAL